MIRIQVSLLMGILLDHSQGFMLREHNSRTWIVNVVTHIPTHVVYIHIIPVQCGFLVLRISLLYRDPYLMLLQFLNFAPLFSGLTKRLDIQEM